MKTKIIIGVILIVLVLLVSSIFIFAGGGLNPISPDNPDFPNNPDTYIVITSPLDGYTVPENGPWGKILVKGALEKTEINGKTVSKIVVSWHDNIDYGKAIFTPTTNWQTWISTDRLGSGYHSLRARAESSTGELLANYTIRIGIPAKYIYEIDSDHLTDIQNSNFKKWGYCISFSFPYSIELDQHVILGKIIKIKGLVHVASLNSYWPGVERDLWVDVWNDKTQQWIVASKTAHISGTGWKDIDVDCLNIWGDWICIAGYSSDGWGALPTDIVDGFKGEVWIQPGTCEYNQSPLEMVLGLFSRGDINSPPGYH